MKRYKEEKRNKNAGIKGIDNEGIEYYIKLCSFLFRYMLLE
jgi:hypothetical protein